MKTLADLIGRFFLWRWRRTERRSKRKPDLQDLHRLCKEIANNSGPLPGSWPLIREDRER